MDVTLTPTCPSVLWNHPAWGGSLELHCQWLPLCQGLLKHARTQGTDARTLSCHPCTGSCSAPESYETHSTSPWRSLRVPRGGDACLPAQPGLLYQSEEKIRNHVAFWLVGIYMFCTETAVPGSGERNCTGPVVAPVWWSWTYCWWSSPPSQINCLQAQTPERAWTPSQELSNPTEPQREGSAPFFGL